MQRWKPDKISTAFLDTTFILPFFGLDIAVEAFNLRKFKEFLAKLSEIHVSELSIFEAKAKTLRLSLKNTSYRQALNNFGDNLSVLRGDEKLIFHPYTKGDDTYFNLISGKNLKLDSFEITVLAQALAVGLLVTEDKEILGLRDQEAFTKDPQLGKLAISSWKDLAPMSVQRRDH